MKKLGKKKLTEKPQFFIKERKIKANPIQCII